MFPTFISILDIQSWWEVPSIAHFCSLFRTAFNLLDFDIEDLEEALLTDGTEETSWLQELIVRLLSGCLPNNEISTFNYQMFLRRLFRQKCQEHDRYNPFNTDVDFQLLPLRTKVDILHALCDFRLDADDVLDQLKNLEADSLRVEPLGYDNNNSAYWYFYGTRLYREDFKTRNNKKRSVWQVICFTEDDWFQLDKKFKESAAKCERQLHRSLSENFLPELPRLFREKERLARKRLLENLPRRTSSRLKKETLPEKEEPPNAPAKQPALEEEEAKRRKRDLENKRREAYERRNKLKEQSEDSQSERSESRYEMGGAKTRQKKSKGGRSRKLSTSSTNSKDAVSRSSKRKKTSEETSKSSTSSTPTTVGRQTNNSLAAATGQIVIQPLANPLKKKLKTSQVFRQTDEDLITGMHKILDYVKNHEDAWPFADPVDEDYAPNYYTVIRKPMDLQRMEERLDSGYYKNFTKFRDDFQLIVDNCRLYNGADNEYTEMVDNLSKVFKRATEKFLDQISSSDDEIAVEFPESEPEVRESKKAKTEPPPPPKASSKRKPTLSAKTDKKRERSVSEESLPRSRDSFYDDEKPPPPTTNKHKDKANKKLCKSTAKKETKKTASNKEKKSSKVNSAKHKKGKYASPVASRSPSRSQSRSPFRKGYSTSPPPSSGPSSPDIKFDFAPKKTHKDARPSIDTLSSKSKIKQKQEKFKSLFENDGGFESDEKPAPKDKHNKLRETIEKLKAKSEISNKLNDDEFCFDLDSPKENKHEKGRKEDTKTKNKKDKTRAKKELDFEDSNSTMESLLSETKKKKNAKNANNKNAAIDALTIATEQTLKDINKWLDDAPKFSEFSSASNSPSYGALDDFDLSGKADNSDAKKKIDKIPSKKDAFGKDIKRRNFNRDPTKFLKRREVQRTIDRLQPGKSKGNLIANVQNSKQTDELFPLGPLSKNKDTKNSLIVKTDDNAPKLSLGSVLDSFGRHKFVDDKKPEEPEEEVKTKIVEDVSSEKKVETETKPKEEKKESPSEESSSMMSGATPNLSAWFKAFGAPKVTSAQKKSDTKTDEKIEESIKKDDATNANNKTPVPDVSPSEIHGQPVPRQRKISTGSSVSERSSFSQDMDSPRVGIDERLGAYPAPYPSPLHRSPTSASPVMASPRPDVSPKAPYPPFNGQIRVGFYQDTVSNKSSPDKSCSPRDNPQSPYAQCSEHVYTPTTTQNLPYSYPNSPYYSHAPNYSNTHPTPPPPYNPDNLNPGVYYDTNKSLTDQYQAKSIQNAPSIDAFRQQEDLNNQSKEKSAMFPVKKRAYNESDLGQMRYNLESSNNNTEQQDEASKQQYTHQNIPEPKTTTTQQQHQLESPSINFTSPANPYNNNYGNDANNYTLNVPSARTLVNQKLDMSKYTNMGYQQEPDVNFARNMQQYNRDTYGNRPPSGSTQQPVCSTQPQPNQQASDVAFRYSNTNPHMGYKPVESGSGNYNANANQATYKTSEVSVPRPTYNAHLEMEQPLGLRGNIANLSHIVDRYNNDERMLSGLQQSATQFYGDKGLSAPHLFNKPIATSASGLPMFNQATTMGMQSYNQNMQVPPAYNRQMADLQGGNAEAKSAGNQQQEKKTKKRKSSKTAQSTSSSADTSSSSGAAPASSQGFQSYAGLKTNPPMEPSAISLKTASVVSGSAFSFGPPPTGLSIGSGLYTTDKDAYPNFLDEFRATPNYYMAAAAAHHRSTPDGAVDKQTRVAHQSSAATQPPSYPFIGAPQPRPPSYPLGAPFMPSQQLVDPGSPLYQQYLQSGLLNQGLLGPPGPYPPGYHPALSMRQSFDSMTRSHYF